MILRTALLMPLCVASFALAACVGAIGERGDGDESQGGDGGTSSDLADFAPPSGMTRRLTKDQYAYTLEDVLGVELGAELALLPPETRTEGFTNNAIGLVVSADHVDAYFALAEAAASAVPDWPGFVEKYAECQTLGDAACENSFVSSLGALLFRRPLTTRETAGFRGLFDIAKTEGLDFGAGARLVLEALLQAPQFLYLLEDETPTPSHVRTVTGYEMASRLAYLIRQSAPDAALYAAAASGELDQAAGVVAQAERLLAGDGTASRATARFVRDWLALDALENTSRADLSSSLALEMLDSAVATYQDHVWQDDAPLAQILTTESATITPALAGTMGLDPKSGALERYSLTGVVERIGILTHPGVLTAISDRDVGGIVARGLFVMEHLMCREALSPPADLNTSAFTTHLGPEATEREYSEDRLSDAACGSCHAQFDPLAYAFERFDGIGRYATENAHGRPLRSDGELVTADGTLPFADVDEYVKLLSEDDSVRHCLAKKHLQFALGSRIEAEQEPAVDAIRKNFDENGGTYRALVLAIVAHEVFRTVRTD